MKGAQIGGTECGNCWIGCVIHQAPGPMMAVAPTVELAKRNSKQRIDPLIEESEVLRERVKERRSRDSGNTVLSKEFPGGVLILTGANSAVGLRSMPARGTCSSTRWTAIRAMSRAKAIRSCSRSGGRPPSSGGSSCWSRRRRRRASRGSAGFHLSSLYSPVGWFSWADAAEMYEQAQKAPDLMKGFVNTVLGLPFEEEAQAPCLVREGEGVVVGSRVARTGLRQASRIDSSVYSFCRVSRKAITFRISS